MADKDLAEKVLVLVCEQNWSGPRSLHEMMKIPDEDMYPLKGMCKMLDYIEERGAKLHVIGLVTKKLQRGLSLSQIAEQAEEDEHTVASICKVIWECEPGSTSEVIYERLFQKNS